MPGLSLGPGFCSGEALTLGAQLVGVGYSLCHNKPTGRFEGPLPRRRKLKLEWISGPGADNEKECTCNISH